MLLTEGKLTQPAWQLVTYESFGINDWQSRREVSQWMRSARSTVIFKICSAPVILTCVMGLRFASITGPPLRVVT
jgi:hypothetical protein